MNSEKVRTTTDYSIFRKLDCNRDVSNSRKETIKKSIANYGYIGAPILVNEKMEIIDGQGRFEACKELKVPVPYMIRQGANVNACIALNQNLRNWTDEDYIKSYAGQGLPGYKYLKILTEKYNVPNQIAHFAATLKQRGGGANSPLRNGLYEMTSAEFERADKVLQKFVPLQALVRKSKAHTQKLSFAVLFAISDPKVNYKRLCYVLEKKCMEIEPFSTIDQLLDELSRIYNYNLRKDDTGAKIDKVFLKEDYARTK